MAISASNITSGADTDGGSTTTTSSISFTAGRLYLLTIANRTGISTDPNQPSVTSSSATWVHVNSIVYDTTSSSRRRINVFRTIFSGDATETVSITYGGQNQTDVCWIMDEFTGIDTSGTHGSGAIVQSDTAKVEGGATSLTITLASFASSDNRPFGGWGISTEYTVGSGFTQLDFQDNGSNSISAGTEWHTTTADNTVDASWSTSSNQVGGVAIELAVAPAGGGSVKDPIQAGVVPFAR